MFSIVIYDRRTDELHLIRDRMGVKPLFIAEHQGGVLFGSEIKALLEMGVAPRLDTRALLQFLAWNYVPPPATIFDGVRHVEPGSCVTISRGARKIHRWWSLYDQAPCLGRREADWSEEITDLLDDATLLRLRSDVPVGAFLSGGVDSSSVVEAMMRAPGRADPVDCFTIGFEDPRFDERRFAREAAERFGARLIERVAPPDLIEQWPETIYWCDQPHGDVSFLPTGLVSKLAREQVTVVLTGDGGDELFAGYDKHLAFFSRDGVLELDDASFDAALWSATCLFDQAGLDRLISRRTDWRGAELQEGAQSALQAAREAGWDRINQALAVDAQRLLPGNNLVKPDRMGMAASLEARAPYMDWRMVEAAFRIPGDLKLRQGQSKYILKKALEPRLGDLLTHRKKQMFTVPIGEWFKTELRSFCDDMADRLVANEMLAPIFNEAEIRRLFSQHVSGAANHTREVRALIALQLWSEIFFFGRDPSEAARATRFQGAQSPA